MLQRIENMNSIEKVGSGNDKESFVVENPAAKILQRSLNGFKIQVKFINLHLFKVTTLKRLSFLQKHLDLTDKIVMPPPMLIPTSGRKLPQPPIKTPSGRLLPGLLQPKTDG